MPPFRTQLPLLGTSTNTFTPVALPLEFYTDAYFDNRQPPEGQSASVDTLAVQLFLETFQPNGQLVNLTCWLEISSGFFVAQFQPSCILRMQTFPGGTLVADFSWWRAVVSLPQDIGFGDAERLRLHILGENNDTFAGDTYDTRLYAPGELSSPKVPYAAAGSFLQLIGST